MSNLNEIYARIPDVECKGLCQEACGPIGMSAGEFATIKDRVGERVRGIQSNGQVFIVGKHLTCPLLNEDGKCSVYSDRPAVCRIFGAVKEMRCPHGCRPRKWMADTEARKVLRDIDSIAS